MLRSALVSMVALALGCGGSSVTFPEPRPAAGDEEPTATVAQPLRSAPATAIKKQPQLSADQNKTQDQSSLATAAHSGSVAPAAQPSARPADLAAWTHDDFRTAKQDRDARLVQAVVLLGRSSNDAQANASLLLELLDKSPVDAPTSALQAPAMHGLAQAIVTALAANPSDVARNALKEILLGTLRTNLDDRTFTVAALSALIDNGDGETETLVYTVLTMPDAIRPPGRGPFTGDALQKECLTLVRGSASPQLRLRLAQYVAHPSTPAPHRALLLPMLIEQRSENLAAQAALALADHFDAGQRTALQRQLLVQARRSIDTLMSAPDTPVLRASDDAAIRSVFVAREPARLEETGRIAEELWSGAFIERLARQLGGVASATEQPDLFALATSLPAETLRPIVRQHLMDHWAESASLISTPQFTPTNVRDPGVLLVLKSLPRDDAQARTPPARTRGNSAQQQRLAEERKARRAWNAAVYTMSSTLMRRCEIAGRVAEIAAAETSPVASAQPLESVEDLNRLLRQRSESRRQRDSTGDISPQTEGSIGAGFPLELPPAAEIETTYHLHWPEQLDGRVHAVVSPLVIHYARLRVEDQGQRAVSFFARQLKGASERPLENGRWLDSASRPAEDKLRSVDVMITRSKPLTSITPVSNRNAVEDLTIEILWIEIADFMSEPDGSPK